MRASKAMTSEADILETVHPAHRFYVPQGIKFGHGTLKYPMTRVVRHGGRGDGNGCHVLECLAFLRT